TRVMLEKDTTIPIHLASARLIGTVEHRLYGPVQGAKVQVGEAATLTGSDGSYDLLTAPQGTHQITVSHPDYDSTRQQVTIGASGSWHDMILTRSICDTVLVEQDASISLSQFEDCADCPDWGGSDRNYGSAEQLKLEYFFRADPGPPRRSFVAQTRILLTLPPLPEGAGRLNMTGLSLLLHPTEEYQRVEWVSMRAMALGSAAWEENSVTWADGPRPSLLPIAAEQVQPGQPLSFDLKQVYRDFDPEGMSVMLQKEEIGEADPAQRLSFWSSEAPIRELRPAIVVKYSY
ncbi:MAG: hypothetical protein OEV80_18640, partial [candidate division Zixibacteria bacterium]|nr:hypothetical protein [candidate division Zixibacteria bacterium]